MDTTTDMKKLRDELLAVEEDKKNGLVGCTIDELDKRLQEIIDEI